MNANLLFLLNLLSTWYMIGLIWMVQIVHYQLFDRVGVDEFPRYERDHTNLITPIVMVPMLVELSTACMLLVLAPSEVPRWVFWVGLGMISIIWLSTFLLSVPCHARLQSGFDPDIYRRLVNTNWIRTVMWSARGGLLGYFAFRLMQNP